MTQEEKVRAYDKALKRAKAAIDIAADKDLVRGVVRTILPELAESEDERIRKELVAFFKEMRDTWHEIYWHDLQVEGILAWLEKQKEQKPTWSEEDEKMLENIRYALRYAYSNSVIDEQTTEYVMAWLKSLRPSWKPSEEQMEQFEIDLEKEIQEYLEKLGGGHGGFVDDLTDHDLTGFARHFYRLGLKARKEEKK